MNEQQLIIRLLFIRRLLSPSYIDDMDQAIEAVKTLQKVKDITARALRSEDPINLYKSLCLKEIAEALKINTAPPESKSEDKGQITFDDII